MLAFGFGIAAAVMAAITATVVVTGAYNVGASAEHLYVTDRLITFALHRSVAVRTYGIDPPKLDDEDMIRLGAEHFKTGCAPCHAAPGQRQNPVVANMYPAPPALREAAEDWTAAEQFWIVKHGIKFTGMPMWPGEERDDEVWAIVAYLQQLTRIENKPTATDSSDKAGKTDFGFALAADPTIESCARCHGGDNSPPVSDLVPALHGQSEDYLARALTEYREGTRQSGIMEPLAAELASDEIEELARYFARLVGGKAADGDAGTQIAGREIAENGVPENGIPPCRVCHSGRASPQFPILAGLSANYIKGQLDLWRKGLRDGTTYGAIMAPIAKRLTERQIDEVAAYFARYPRENWNELSAEIREGSDR